MTQTSWFSAVLLAVSLFGEARASGWTLFWQDEFDGPADARPDSSKWNIEVVENPYNNELQYYTNRARNVRLNGAGQLELTAYKEDYLGKQYTSGRVNTAGKFEQTYGRWEARVRLPAGTGFWPAFWLLGSDNGCGVWPDCGEVDIMEFRGRVPDVSSSAAHGPGYSGDTPLVHAYTLPGGSPTFTAGYHTFAMEWTPSSMRFSVDSVLHYTVDSSAVAAYGNWVFNHNFHTLLNLAVGGVFDNGQVPPDSAFPAKMTVDYVRVYTFTGTPILPGARAVRGKPRLSVDLARGQVLLTPAGGAPRNLLGRENGSAAKLVAP